MLCSYTDHLDGKIARKTNQITTFGKFLDPIADKALNNSLIIFLAVKGEMSFLVPVVYIFRDIVVDGVRLIAASNNKIIAASIFGKIKTVVQVIQITLTLVLYPFINILPFLTILLIVVNIIGVLCSLISGFEYVIKNKDIILEGDI